MNRRNFIRSTLAALGSVAVLGAQPMLATEAVFETIGPQVVDRFVRPVFSMVDGTVEIMIQLSPDGEQWRDHQLAEPGEPVHLPTDFDTIVMVDHRVSFDNPPT